MKSPSDGPAFPSILQEFFSQRLINQKNASARTVATYRDAFRLLLTYAEERLRKTPSSMTLADLDAPVVLKFLDYLENDRSNSVRTRNARLAAIRSFMKFAGLRDPASLPVVQRVMAIPMKRFQRTLVGFLSRNEMRAILDAPDSETWSGKRDRVMFALFYNTGARVSEITGLRVGDVDLGGTGSVKVRGKGRKERVIPLWRDTAQQLRQWLRKGDVSPDSPLFPNRSGVHLTRSGVERRLDAAVRRASKLCTSLANRRVSPHVLRHTTAMHLLQSGVDLSVIALWLGHESSSTTHIYMEADLSMKERALRSVEEPRTKRLRYRASDKVLQFLESL